MDLGNVATLKILWTEIANNMGRRPRIPPSGSLSPFPAARSGAHLVPSYRAPELLPILYHAGHDSSRRVPRSEEKWEAGLLTANEAKDCLLGCRSPTSFCRRGALLNRLIAPSPHILDKQWGGPTLVCTHGRTSQSNERGARCLGMDDRPQVAPSLVKGAGFASRLGTRRESRAGSQDRRHGRLPRMIGTPSKVRSERADLGISDSLVLLHTCVLTGLGRRLATCQTVNSTSQEALADPGRRT